MKTLETKIVYKDFAICRSGELSDFTQTLVMNELNITEKDANRMVRGFQWFLNSLGLDFDIFLKLDDEPCYSIHRFDEDKRTDVKDRKDAKLKTMICDYIEEEDKREELYNKITNMYKL